MKVSIAALSLLVSVTALSAIPVNASGSVPNGGFSVWVQAQQQTGYCDCLDANTRGLSCKAITSCLATGECQRPCPKPM